MLLVFRLPAFATEAWRHGRRAAQLLERRTTRAFRDLCAHMLREDDCIAHDPDSELFLVALLSAPRASTTRSAADCRSVLERMSASLERRCEVRVESGWAPLQLPAARSFLEAAVGNALERGARERERYAFFATVGHELRTPLTSIRGYLDTLLDDAVDETTSRRFLETARREALRMTRMLDGIFTFSMLDLSWNAEARQCSLREQLLHACEAVRPLAAERAMHIQIGRIDASTLQSIAEDALLQALLNVLENAVKYGGRGGTIRVAASFERGEATVIVDDDGPGLCEPADTLFSFGARGSNGTQTRGSGIGLAVVKTIVERAGGCVRCGPSPLGGARFELALPARAESARAAS